MPPGFIFTEEHRNCLTPNMSPLSLQGSLQWEALTHINTHTHTRFNVWGEAHTHIFLCELHADGSWQSRLTSGWWRRPQITESRKLSGFYCWGMWPLRKWISGTLVRSEISRCQLWSVFIYFISVWASENLWTVWGADQNVCRTGGETSARIQHPADCEVLTSTDQMLMYISQRV